MPASVMTLFPQALSSLEAMKLPLQATLALNQLQMQSLAASADLFKNTQDMTLSWARHFSQLLPPGPLQNGDSLLKIYQDGANSLLNLFKENWTNQLNRFQQQRTGELEFLDLLTDQYKPQQWNLERDQMKLLLDLPGMRVIDISADVRHRIHNYAVVFSPRAGHHKTGGADADGIFVFSPRAGHHSNIAERVALFLRDHGLTRMAVVEQKCAQDIPLNVDGHRHQENFEGQVDQYRQVLELLKQRTGHAPHLIAICQPGPLLLSTLILHPELGKTFGSAGSPMHTEAEKGFLTEFARGAGESYIDGMLTFFGHTIGEDHPGAGRLTYDGRLQVLGFYLLAWDQHFKNYKNLLSDMKKGNGDAARRQKSFYQWYNTVHHFPAGFIRDTYKKIFVQNALIRGNLEIGGRKVNINDYPVQTPIWALGGTADHIAPPMQAVGHLDLMPEMPTQKQLRLLCDAGHMGLFRSSRVLDEYYSRIAEFLMVHSDYACRKFIY